MNGVLADKSIINEVENGGIVITPFNRDSVNPNSYDVSVGNISVRVGTDSVGIPTFKRDKAIYTQLEPHKHSKHGNVFTLSKGNLYLVSTKEYIELNNTLRAIVFAKSSSARDGLKFIFSSGYVDYGFKGYLTLALEPMFDISIVEGERVAQLEFCWLDSKDATKYHGRYNNMSEIPQGTILD